MIFSAAFSREGGDGFWGERRFCGVGGTWRSSPTANLVSTL